MLGWPVDRPSPQSALCASMCVARLAPWLAPWHAPRIGAKAGVSLSLTSSCASPCGWCTTTFISARPKLVLPSQPHAPGNQLTCTCSQARPPGLLSSVNSSRQGRKPWTYRLPQVCAPFPVGNHKGLTIPCTLHLPLCLSRSSHSWAPALGEASVIASLHPSSTFLHLPPFSPSS